MPLPRASEQAASEVAAILARLDDDLVDYVADGGTFPNLEPIFDAITAAVIAALTAAIREVEPGGTPTAGEVADAVGPIREQVNVAARRARRARTQVDDTLPEQAEGESVAEFVARVGVLTAWAVAVRGAATAQRRTLARSRGVPMPRRTSAHGRMVIRTESAVRRNTHAADVVDRRNATEPFRASQQPRAGDWVVYVEDARKGPTDEPCERVNGRYATAEWARRHPVEHPNCTRRTRPVRLPAGRRVTLLV